MEHLGQPTKVMELGTTEVPEDMFMEMLGDVREKFTAEKYHSFTNNSNHFSNTVTDLLLGTGIPENILASPQELLNTRLGM